MTSFDLGGISLMAVRVVSRLQKSLGRPIAIRDLFNHPTVASFAAALSPETTAPVRPSNLVPIRTTGRQRPLFLVHPVGGEVQYARDLAPWLDADLPVYGIAAQGFGIDEAPVDSMDEMVALYVRAIRHVQPRGPYRVAGWSAGGLIAYEIARRLLNTDEVEFIGVIDTFARPAAPDSRGMTVAAKPFPSETDFLLRWLPERVSQDILDRLHALAAAADIKAMLAICQAHDLLPRDIPRDIEPGLLRRHLAVAYAIEGIIGRYTTVPVAAEVFLFAAADEPRADEALGWRAVLGQRLRLVRLKGTHLSLVRPSHVEALGAAISDALTSGMAADAEPKLGVFAAD